MKLFFYFSEELVRPCTVNLGLDACEMLNDCKIKKNQEHAGVKICSSKLPSTCMLCNRYFSKRFNMRHHMRKDHAGQYDICRWKHNGAVCAQVFRSEADKFEHILKVHKQKMVRCEFCFKAYSETHKSEHFLIWHKNDLFRCRYFNCCTYFRSEVEKRKHESLTHETKNTLKCIFCSFYFRPNRIKGHLLTKHKSQLPFAFKCNRRCYSYFLTESELNEHIASSHKTKMRSEAMCVYCNNMYADVLSLNEHIKRFHSDIKITCKFRGCKHFFHSQTQADAHFEQQHQKIQDNKKYQCSKCDYKGSFKHNLEEHILRIHGEKNQPCSKCSMRFRSSYALKKHLKSAHTSPHQCQHCGDILHCTNNLRQHQFQTKCKNCQQVLSCCTLYRMHTKKCKL